MAANGYRTEYEKDAYETGGYSSDERLGETEKGLEDSKSKDSDDPFGDESKSEVKYRTMAWW